MPAHRAAFAGGETAGVSVDSDHWLAGAPRWSGCVSQGCGRILTSVQLPGRIEQSFVRHALLLATSAPDARLASICRALNSAKLCASQIVHAVADATQHDRSQSAKG
jgi:hypothetical protein